MLQSKSPLGLITLRSSFLLLMFFAFSFSSHSQVYQPPVAPENAYPTGVNVSPINSSNYLFQDVTLAAYDDGNNGQVIWQFINQVSTAPICQGTINYAGGYSHLEVGALNGNVLGYEYVAFVAYHQAGVGHAVDLYGWDASACSITFLGTNALSANPNSTRISMDCHIDYALAIGWIDAGTLNTTTYESSTITPTFIHTITPTIKPNDVDVAFSHGAQLYVHYVYNDYFIPAIEVCAEDFWVMQTAGAPTTYVPMYEDLNMLTGADRAWCNIDGPDHGVDNWAYTYTENYRDISIRLIDINTGIPPTTFILNDGSFGNIPNNWANNWAPIPAYDMTFNRINIGWITRDAGYAYVNVEIANDGSAMTSTMDYLRISNVGAALGGSPILAYSKMTEFSIPWLYAFFNEDNAIGANDFKHKYHDMNFATNFKVHHQVDCPDHRAGTNALNLTENGLIKELEIYPNPFVETFVIADLQEGISGDIEAKLFDLAGNLLMNQTANLDEVNAALKTISGELESGVYILEVLTKNDNAKYSNRLVKK